MQRQFYLEDIPLDDAKSALASALQAIGLWQPLGTEQIAVSEANDRITATPIWAKLSSPHYHASAMDGFAVRANDTHTATETNPLSLTLIEDKLEVPADVTSPAVAVNTGHPLPAWANAVVMIEHTQAAEDENGRSAIEIRASIPPWHHVRPMGEDMVATELVLPANHKLRPVDLGAIAGSGHAVVEVYRQPRVAVIPTGSELIAAETAVSAPPTPGQIIEYNSIVLASQVENWGGIPTRWPIVPDRFDDIQQAVKAASQEHDLILLNAGSSAGSEDYTAHVVQSLGTLLVHGVAVRPGHPVILGLIDKEERREKREEREGEGAKSEENHTPDPQSPTPNLQPQVPIIGVPGYPVSAALTGEIFVEPLLAMWQGQPALAPPTIEATLTRKVASHTGDDDFVRVAVGKVSDKVMVTPISRGAGVITSLVRADGLVRIPRFSEGEDAGNQVTVHLYRSPSDIDKTILMIGSHDLTLDILAQFLAQNGVRLSSANVGSLGGLVALRRGECHLAGSHLLNPENGEYNVSYIQQYLPNQTVNLVRFVNRDQGWIVPKGNPKRLKSWEDIGREGIRYVNRQRGAGTRVLLDYELNQRHVKANDIVGYDREEYTHLAVAAAIASGTADFGLGVHAAAQALDLDFVPLAQEQYELLIPDKHMGTSLLQTLLETINEPDFQTAVSQLPGYDISQMGSVRTISPT